MEKEARIFFLVKGNLEVDLRLLADRITEIEGRRLRPVLLPSGPLNEGKYLEGIFSNPLFGSSDRLVLCVGGSTEWFLTALSELEKGVKNAQFRTDFTIYLAVVTAKRRVLLGRVLFDARTGITAATNYSIDETA